MLFRRICLLLTFLLGSSTAHAAGEASLNIKTVAKAGAAVSVDRVIKDGKVLVSVSDESGKPLMGLGAGDFSLTQAGRRGKILSAQPIAESLDVPRHIVLVLDNSYSMQERNAVKALLEGVDSLLKIVRPIDTVYLVTFDNKLTTTAGSRVLHVRSIQSSRPDELKASAREAYGLGLTPTTVLYEGMLAGLDILGRIPASEPRFMVVFSDGEDLNSAFKAEDVLTAALAVGKFNAYAIDYMPVPDTNKFLARFASRNNGQIWKATSETNLVPIFQSVASRMQYYYVLSYQFPPTGRMAVVPDTLTINQLQAGEAVLATRIDMPELKLLPVIDSLYGIARWKASAVNSRGAVAELAGEGALPTDMKLPLPTGDLDALAAGGDLNVKLELVDRNGQELLLTTEPVKLKTVTFPGRLTAAPASLTIDQVLGLATVTRAGIDANELTLRAGIDSAGWIARWKAVVSNSTGGVAELTGEGTPPAELKLPLPVSDLAALAAGGDLNVRMELQNRAGKSLVLAAAPIKLTVTQTRGKLVVEPAGLTIEEIKTIDSSPMLGQIFFAKGSGEISAPYVRFSTPGETSGFDEQKFRDTMEKYRQVLNIIGKRLTATPAATITLTGCNDNTGEEKGRKKLSTRRAEAVRDYLQTVWGIAPERMAIEARNLPRIPGTSRSREGQAENRRVEITSSDPKLPAPIRSTYTATRIDTPALTLRPEVTAPYGIARWKVTASNSAGSVTELSGKEAPARETRIALDGKDLQALAAAGDITVRMELQDRKGQELTLSAPPTKVTFIQTSQRLARKEGLRVQEKYALILFDFDKDSISPANQEIVNTIVARFKTLPNATIAIVGHTDNIGAETYNIKLSQRRAAAVNKMMTNAFTEPAGERVRFSGVGPEEPLFDNLSPEGRSFNRTVTITLEYTSTE